VATSIALVHAVDDRCAGALPEAVKTGVSHS
jgi:hypothetical protein